MVGQHSLTRHSWIFENSVKQSLLLRKITPSECSPNLSSFRFTAPIPPRQSKESTALVVSDTCQKRKFTTCEAAILTFKKAHQLKNRTPCTAASNNRTKKSKLTIAFQTARSMRDAFQAAAIRVSLSGDKHVPNQFAAQTISPLCLNS